jgi:hypothetical protein
MTLRVPTLLDLTKETSAIQNELQQAETPQTILQLTYRYTLMRNLQRAMASEPVEKSLTEVNTALLKVLHRVLPVVSAEENPDRGAGVEGGGSGPAVSVVAPVPVQPQRRPSFACAVDEAPAELPMPKNEQEVAAQFGITEEELKVVRAAEQAGEPAPASDGWEAPRKRGRPSKGKAVHSVDTPTPVVAVPEPVPEPAPPAPVQYTDLNIHEHPQHKEMVDGWTGAQLREAYEKLVGTLPAPTMTSGQIAGRVLLLQLAKEKAPEPPAQSKASKQPKQTKVIEIDEQGEQTEFEFKPQTKPIPQTQAPQSAKELAVDLQAEVDRIDAQSKSGPVPKDFPPDPMPLHLDAHKVWFGNIDVFECDRCKSDDLVMCIPSHPFEGKLLCATRCRKCGDTQTFPLSTEDATEIRKVGKILSSQAPRSRLAPPEEPESAPAPKKKKRAAVAAENPAPSLVPSTVQPGTMYPTGSAPSPSPTKPGKMITVVDPSQLLASCLGGIPTSPVNTEAVALELQEQIKLWPVEKRIAEYEKLTGKTAPQGNLIQFADTEAVRAVAQHYAGATL